MPRPTSLPRSRSWFAALGFAAALLIPHGARTAPPSEEGGEPAPATGQAAPATGQAAPATGDATPPAGPSAAELARAERLRALARGELDPAVDAKKLLAFDLEAASPTLRELVLAWLGARVGVAPESEPGSESDPFAQEIDAAREPVAAALRELLALAPDELVAKLDAHAELRRAYLEAQAEAKLGEERAQALQARAKSLAELRAGTLELERDPKALFRVDLLEAARSPAPAAPTGAPAPTGAGAPAPTGAVEAPKPSAAAAWFNELRASSRGEAGIEGLIAKHEARRKDASAAAAAEAEADAASEAEKAEREAELAAARNEAEKAAADRQAALEAAAAAENEKARAIANRKAALLGVREQLAKYAQNTTELSTARSEAHTQIEELLAPAGELESKRGDLRAEADLLFGRTNDALVEAQRELAALLDASPRRNLAPRPDEPPAHGFLSPANAELYQELVTRADELDARYAEVHGAAVVQLAEDTQALNRSRLAMLAHASSELRSRATGFGPVGVRNFKRELEQIGLFARVEAQRIPDTLAKLGDDFRTSPVPLIWALFRILFGVFVFRWWRRAAPKLLGDLRDAAAESEGSWARIRATLFWYLERVRRPLELFALTAWILSTIENIPGLPKLQLLWLAAFWITAGLTMIAWVDGLAARQGRAHVDQADTSVLRVRSLRLVGLTIVVTGLVLSATSSIVGDGTIYAWVWRTTWVLSLPILLLLISWWQPFIFARIEREQERGPVASWVLARREGWIRFPAATVGGIYLMGGGLRRWALRQADSVEMTRRLLAFLFRREVAKQAEAEDESAYRPLEPEVVAKLWDDEALAPHTELWTVELDAVAALAAEEKNTLSCVVGERGLGKSTFIKVLADRIDDEQRVISLRSPKGDFAKLLAGLCEALGLPADSSPDAVTKSLGAEGHTTVIVDDLHRIVRPALNGLEELDKLVAFVRDCGNAVDWIACFDAPAWQYVKRARGDRVFFDQVIELPRWDQDVLDEFLTERTKAAGLEPNFEHLKLPRRFDDGELEEAERNRRAFIRILGDSAQGNPTVALELWARALVRDQSGEVRARLPSDARYRELDYAEIGVYFVLRALVQLDLATLAEIGDCTRIRNSEVADAMRFVQSRDLVERQGDHFRVALHAYRPIRNLLRRQNLLAI